MLTNLKNMSSRQLWHYSTKLKEGGKAWEAVIRRGRKAYPMESRRTFLHLHVGFKRDVGEGQWLGSMVIPSTDGNVRTEAPVRRGRGHAPMLPRKASRHRHVGRTKTDTGVRVQTYQGAREKPR